MAILKAQALVLKRQDFRETSLLVWLYTREFGKINGLMKGIRKDPRKFASTVDLYSLNDVIFYQSRTSSLHLISHCDAKAYYPAVRADMAKSASATLMMELVQAVMPQEDKNQEIFDLTCEALKELETTTNPEKVMMLFKIKVLTLSGFQPHFDSCLACGKRIISEAKFSLGRGGLLCPACLVKDNQARTVYRGTIASMLYIQRNPFRSTLTLGLNTEIKKELNLITNGFINFHLEKELKSQRVFNALNTGTSSKGTGLPR